MEDLFTPRISPRRSKTYLGQIPAGTLLSMNHEFRVKLPQRKGSIVNISSAVGKVGGGNASVYVASKHAIEGLTELAAIEVARTGVRVNIVGPGPVETGMLNRFIEAK
jgi:NAD(P)-dependent dehydrogenase (short-subunit alcohol dehydrogenase family)